jgi:hypothetical protein
VVFRLLNGRQSDELFWLRSTADKLCFVENNSASSDKIKLKKNNLSLQFRALADLVETRGFCVGFGIPANYNYRPRFLSLISSSQGEKVICKKHHFFRFYSRFFDTVEPYSNDRGCHRLLLIGDSPMCPGSENVNMFNTIDRKFVKNEFESTHPCQKRNLYINRKFVLQTTF